MAESVSLRPMTQAEYDQWKDTALGSYSAEMAETGVLDATSAKSRAEEQHRQFLPDGLVTRKMHLMRVLDATREAVGVLWLGPHPRRPDHGFVYDIEIEADRRGEGLGRAAMLAAESVARAEGWTGIGLDVFGPNERARSLYDSLGYRVVSTSMSKALDDA